MQVLPYSLKNIVQILHDGPLVGRHYYTGVKKYSYFCALNL